MDLFGKKKIANLEKEIQHLKGMLHECGIKLTEKQEHINKTNAFWKKKMHDLTHSKSKKNKL
jgi:hypothetical protein